MTQDISNEVSLAEDLSGRYLTFYLDKTVYGIELANVLEIIQVQAITPVPNVPAYIKGVANLRGKIIPIIDVRTKFFLPEIPYTEKTCVIVVLIHEMQVGLIVDSVSDVLTVEIDQQSDLPNFGSSETNKYLASITKVGERVILNIDCEKFFRSDLSEFENI